LNTQKILGIEFFHGNVEEAVAYASDNGGLVVAPAGPTLVKLRYDEDYRRAIVEADLALPDSGWMVLLWLGLRARKLNRISGLKYFEGLTAQIFANKTETALWVLPSESAREKTRAWLERNHVRFEEEELYVAPFYSVTVEDKQLLELVARYHPKHIIIGVGGGTQEKLGLYLREQCGYRPAIHCIGAALGFLTGDQAPIPDWADKFYLGWLLRLLREPRAYLPRYLSARELPGMMLRYGENLPPLVRR
jgi:UDP-N-acetyl-D-mannosaminuronic acid transferase (WecB/TagA/CpsF family)